MSDTSQQPPATQQPWAAAFAAMPLERAPEHNWQRITSKLDAGRISRTLTSRKPIWLAAAAALVLAIALPWQLSQRGDVPDPGTSPSPTVTTSETLETFYAQSAQLESLLRVARDDRVSTGTAAAMAAELDSRVASIDMALMRPGLSPDQQMSLWGERVEALRTVASFESTRRWLAVSGSRYDGALAQVD